MRLDGVKTNKHQLSKMVNSCCVRGCHNKQGREKDRRYFVVPRVLTGKEREMEELATRGRRESTLMFQTFTDELRRL